MAKQYTITIDGISFSAPTQAEAIDMANEFKRKRTHKNTGKQGTGEKAPKEPKPQPTFELNGKAVKATGYLPKAVYSWNKSKAIEMGGEVSVADKVFVATFKSEAKAKAYAKVAAYEIPEADYEVIKAERESRKKSLSKAEKKAIRSKCAKACTGKDGKIDRDKYDAMCKEHGVDNHR